MKTAVRERRGGSPVIQALRRLRQENCRKSEANLDYTMSSRLGYRLRACLNTHTHPPTHTPEPKDLWRIKRQAGDKEP